MSTCCYFLILMPSQSARIFIFNSMSPLNTILAVIACDAVRFVLWKTHATDTSSSLHRSVSPSWCSYRFLVYNMSPRTWWPFLVWHLPVDSLLLWEYDWLQFLFNRVEKSFLNLFQLTNMIFCGLGYLARQILLNI